MKRIIWLACAWLGVCALTGCVPQQQDLYAGVPNPVATIEIEGGYAMRMELYPGIAPNTVSNMVELIEAGFYDGQEFFRVVPGFVIQTGDPNGIGNGGPGYTIRGEFSSNGFDNLLSHTRGVVSMARLPSDPDSAGSQFFIMHTDDVKLDGEFAAFGKLIDQESYDTLDLIANTPTDANAHPLLAYKIERMTVDTQGYKYTAVKNEEE